jgi:hypothetical protein
MRDIALAAAVFCSSAGAEVPLTLQPLELR